MFGTCTRLTTAIYPIETPEGPNIGLIASLSTYARVNEYGFIETPYRIVSGGVVTDEIKFFTALEEENQVIAQANLPHDGKGNITQDVLIARVRGEFSLISKNDVTLMDVGPAQLVSVAASLVPFLENDDANALMGMNMMPGGPHGPRAGASGRYRNGASGRPRPASPRSRVARE